MESKSSETEIPSTMVSPPKLTETEIPSTMVTPSKLTEIPLSKPIIKSNRELLEESREFGEKINCILLSDKFINIKRPLLWLCQSCKHKFSESYYNFKVNNRGCLKCSYRKFNYNK